MKERLQFFQSYDVQEAIFLKLFLIIQGVVLILGTLLLSGIEMSDTLKIAIVLLVNSICSTVANSIFVFIKHLMRVNILKRLGLEVSEKNISVLESLEYQSV